MDLCGNGLESGRTAEYVKSLLVRAGFLMAISSGLKEDDIRLDVGDISYYVNNKHLRRHERISAR